MPKYTQLPASQQQSPCALQINARESLRCERDILGGKPIVRIIRMKPDSSGDLRPAGPQIEFAAKHLAGVIAMLHGLQESEAGNE
jgi:hypothetical protein